MARTAILSLALLSASLLCAQKPGKPPAAPSPADLEAKDRMERDIQFLASDRLEGRETGLPGEQLAGDYLTGRFQELGLAPLGDSATFRQAFSFAIEPVPGPKNSLQLGRNKLKAGVDFYPVSYSPTATMFTRLARCKYGILAPELSRNDFDGVDVKDHAAAICISSPNGIHPHSKFIAHNDIRARIDDAVKLGANAILLYNDDPDAEDPDSTLSAKIQAVSVPVLFVTQSGFKKMGLDGDPVVISSDVVRAQHTGHNIVGLLDNGKPNVVVIGAHYDHLGYGHEGSLYRGAPAIHNGADDNASGVALMLQLAHDLKTLPGAQDNDYLFIAFSGEEKGLYGSNYWTKHPTLPLGEVDYMINLDMVGRLDTTSDISISGTGTAPVWAEAIKNIKAGALKVKTSDGGIGPSDHTSFYLQGVPAIHFFTGSHADYHKPSDDEEKINYDGMVRVTRFIEELVVALDDDPKLTFTKTADTVTTEAPRFTVTLGVVPDYMYDG
ncbi:MAG TPA: M20/M25/M40 family metallo-hydrolase, partial [Flavobacteriales bacterium]|nr:M20/M25/M40 family metallo-hydrolase [Flavobacteriales bacterium]